MKKRIDRYVLLLLCAGVLLSSSCKKLLNQQPSTNIFVPSTLADFMSLLQDHHTMNRSSALGDISSDNYFLSYTFWQTLPSTQHNAYIWAPNIYGSETNIEDWKVPYTQILNSNVILEGLENIGITRSNETEWKQMKGSALFFRANAFFQVAQLFSPYYDSLTAHQPYGIPLRLSASIASKSQRSTVAQTYNQILSDLMKAIELLAPSVQNHKNLPSRSAAFGLLARIYLSMADYDKALMYSSLCLNTHSALLNYNDINLNTNNPFKGNNQEIIFLSEFYPSATLMKGAIAPGTIIHPELYQSYDMNDLRKNAFFLTNSSGLPNSKSSYSGTIYQFSGLATDEILLIRAECEARIGSVQKALDDLNTLLENRWMLGKFKKVIETDRKKVITLILEERRKELPFRSVRWTDLRRLNKEGLDRTLTRELNGNSFILPPNDRRYVLPIPYDIIGMTGMEQNPR